MLSSLSLSPFNLFIINFFTFSSLYFFLSKKLKQKQNMKIFFLYGWIFGFGYFVTNLYWISISLTFDQSFKFLIPFSPNNSNWRTDFPTSSEFPHEKPTALLALLTAVSISLSDLIVNLLFYIPIAHHNFLTHLAMEHLETCKFSTTYLILGQTLRLQKKII